MKTYEQVGIHVIYKNKETKLDESKFANVFICHCNVLEHQTAAKLRAVALRHEIPVICIVESNSQVASPGVTMTCDSVGNLSSSSLSEGLVYMRKNRFGNVNNPVII